MHKGPRDETCLYPSVYDPRRWIDSYVFFTLHLPASIVRFARSRVERQRSTKTAPFHLCYLRLDLSTPLLGYEEEAGVVANDSPWPKIDPFRLYGPAAVIARPPASTPSIKRSPGYAACICTTTGRCCCPRGTEAILSHRNRVWVLCIGRSRERCRRARGLTGRGRRHPELLGDPSSSPGTCKYSPEKVNESDSLTCIRRFAACGAALVQVKDRHPAPVFVWKLRRDPKLKVQTRTKP